LLDGKSALDTRSHPIIVKIANFANIIREISRATAAKSKAAHKRIIEEIFLKANNGTMPFSNPRHRINDGLIWQNRKTEFFKLPPALHLPYILIETRRLGSGLHSLVVPPRVL
jgi:hypothetical protein